MDGQGGFSWLNDGAIGAAIGSLATYAARLLFDRRKVKAEADTAQLDADTKAVELYERFSAHLNPQIELLKTQQLDLFEKVATLKIENADLKIENRELKAENVRLNNEVTDLHSQVDKLKAQMP